MSPERTKFFLDTNILVYTFDSRSRAKQTRSRALLSEALETRRGIISYQVVQEFLNVATRKFKQPMRHSEAQNYLTQILVPICEIYPDWALFERALLIANETGFSFYDSLIVSSAAAARCDILWTEDLQHGQRIAGVEILNPFQA